MARPPVTQQTTTTLPLHAELARIAPRPRTLAATRFSGLLQWALEGRGWGILRPALDSAMLVVAVALARQGTASGHQASTLAAPILALPPIVLLLFYLRGLYRSRLRALLLDGAVPVLSAISVGVMATAMLGLLLHGQAPSEQLELRAWVFSLIAVGAGRITLATTQSWARARRLVGKPVLIMGAGMVGAQVARRLEGHPEYGLVPVGFLDTDPRSVAEVGGRDLPVLGTIEDLDDTVDKTGVKNLIVAFSSVADARVSRLFQRCQELGVEVSVVPRMFDTINNRVGYDTVGGLPLMSFTMIDPRGAQFMIKHALDRVLAVVLLVVLAPLIICAAIAVALTSKGPVLFRQRRVGRDGKAFDLYKFRSMRMKPGQTDPGEDDAGPIEHLLSRDIAPGGVEGEDRRTAVGRVLRRCSLDELPQLVNVLRGEMSLIGPRPERPEFVELFGQDIVRYGDRHRVKSGITGWAQVHGLRGQTSLDERVEWDNYYIAHWSLGLDMKILALTIFALFHSVE
ncbi:MAG: exopolysaccharide biosynthesis polyprenyl glycosylphosphotransferase [Actinobacteria bacterium]|nr:MAG: exopolysaccharide biosynthesis polyprenyl glycosylphosphotransferase [Actinomycetota bacterium]